ncbi:putative ATP-dependent endonuclease of OLD family [Pedobacter sp. AK017]|uniref:ATP-dependent nuclease n=1 Tax=Pedobacter sp. AK017 TaxID=2723073 RepID=UPI00160B1351|nr:AAA family ATPase [Pedobacter sp. AK017]MBB5438005.1 putative ATP-dependent endonuclease of OLD family [Pedobacter sp. AK017]
MAKTSKPAEASDEMQFMALMPNPRLVKLIVKNFRCIGKHPVHIDLDDIVVLVGSNNAGKSSLLRAYELVMSEGSKAAEIKTDDFPNNVVDPDNLPEIELHTIVYATGVGDMWIDRTSNDELLVRERWIWKGVGKPDRRGWDVKKGEWHPTKAPFGPANIANSRRPEPHKVDAFSKPEEQAEAIKRLLLAAIQEKVNQMRSAEERNQYHAMLDAMHKVQLDIIGETRGQIDTANNELTNLIGKVFPNYQVNFDAQPENNANAELFKWNSELLMGPIDGFMSTIDKQGSGARRTLLWTALKYISESIRPPKDDEAPTRPHILLIDEPEICLHPNAIREACKVLYDLPTLGNWQVMVTTHSPIFIDFSRNNTTIIRVERNVEGEVEGTTIFRPEKANLDDDDKINLKLLNICDPYVAEFLFGGKVIVVEGDTEYTAFNYIRSVYPEEYKNLHIIRARGKATIVSLVKILNHFGTSYSVLHDSDTPYTKAENKNPAWGNNPNILEAVAARPEGTKVRLLASLPNFEQAYFNMEVSKEKPYNAINTLKNDEEKFKVVKMLLDGLVDHAEPVPNNCLEWSTLDELQKKVEELLVN